MPREVATLELIKGLFSRGMSKNSVQNYYGLLTLFAYAQYSLEVKDQKATEVVAALLNGYPQNFGQAKCNFENYKFGGLAKAYFILQGFMPEERENLRLYAKKTMKAPADRDGILCMPHCPEKEQVWIDVIYAVTPFMLYAGLALGEDKYVEFAFKQCEKMYELFLDEECGLLHQARGFMAEKDAISHDHWARGNGWAYFGLTELVKHLREDSPYRDKALSMYRALSENLLRYQTHLGLWRQEIPCELAWVESSGTALFAYGYGAGIRLGILDKEKYQKAFENAIIGLGRHCIGTDYTTKLCSSGCLCPGQGEKKGTVSAYLTDIFSCYDEGHSFGAFMLAMLEAYRNGIFSLTIGNNV